MSKKFPSLPHFSKKTWIILLIFILVLAALPGLALVRFTTSHPSFCLSCHQNQEPSARWLPSRAHPSSVVCSDCHSQPSSIWRRPFSASSKLINENCRRCHPSLPQKEQENLDNVRIIKISHKSHTQKDLSCLECHSNIQHDALNPRTNRPRMETCYKCHQAHPRTQACDHCHPINLVYSQKDSRP